MHVYYNILDLTSERLQAIPETCLHDRNCTSLRPDHDCEFQSFDNNTLRASDRTNNHIRHTNGQGMAANIVRVCQGFLDTDSASEAIAYFGNPSKATSVIQSCVFDAQSLVFDGVVVSTLLQRLRFGS